MEEEEAEEEEEEKEEKRGGGWGVFTVTVRVQRSSYNHICCHYEHSCRVCVCFFFSTVARGVGQPFRHGA